MLPKRIKDRADRDGVGTTVTRILFSSALVAATRSLAPQLPHVVLRCSHPLDAFAWGVGRSLDTLEAHGNEQVYALQVHVPWSAGWRLLDYSSYVACPLGTALAGCRHDCNPYSYVSLSAIVLKRSGDANKQGTECATGPVLRPLSPLGLPLLLCNISYSASMCAHRTRVLSVPAPRTRILRSSPSRFCR